MESTVTGRALSAARPSPKPLLGSTEPTIASAACTGFVGNAEVGWLVFRLEYFFNETGST